MKLIPFTHQAEQILYRLNHEFNDPYIISYIKNILQAVEAAHPVVYLITNHRLEDKQLKSFPGDPSWIIRLHETWQRYLGCVINKPALTTALWQELELLGVPILTGNEHESHFIFQLPEVNAPTSYFILLPNPANIGTLIRSLYFISMITHLNRGELPVHASAVCMQDGAYLFGGPSGAGKTTIASLLSDLGGEIIDDDRVIISRNSSGGYFARAWGSSTRENVLPVRAIFELNQSDHNHTERFSQRDLAQFLITQAQDVGACAYPDDLFIGMFRLIAEMARCLPGYLLHFQKTPQVWQLIKEALHG